jgi:CBS-domain-containing membrane protein
MSTVAVHLDRLLEPLADCFSVDVAAKVASARVDAAMQSRIDYLADRSNEGLLTVDEREEYAGYVRAIDVITVLQAKARAIVRGHS